MGWLRENPVFALLVAVIVSGCVAEVYWTIALAGESSELESMLSERVRLLREVSHGSPAPMKANRERARINSDVLEARLEASRSELRRDLSDEIEIESTPIDSEDVYFRIVSLVGELRKSAGELGIGVKEDENFGFDEFVESGEGPSPEVLRVVDLQRSLIRFLMDLLYAAGPREIVEVQREPVYPARGSAADSSKPFISKDLFEIDEKVSARILDIIDTLGIRLVYTGQTRTLRQFLNSLNHFERPYVVRGVEVKPVSETGKQRGRELLGPSPFGFSGDAGRGEDSSAILIVKENYSEFSVIVEYIVGTMPDKGS